MAADRYLSVFGIGMSARQQQEMCNALNWTEQGIWQVHCPR